MSIRRLPQTFYEQDTHEIAKQLLGKLLVKNDNGVVKQARISEVECYVGEDDLACHASRGRTQRTEVMYGEAGHAYVYLVYGMYNMLNIVTAAKNFPAAILIRGAVAVKNISQPIDGPGKLTKTLSINRSFNGIHFPNNQTLSFYDDRYSVPRTSIQTSPRIGVDYAGEDAKLPWRYFVNLSETATVLG